jgi:hypothetical protein
VKYLVLLIISALLVISNSHAAVEGAPFVVDGERIDIVPPTGWRLTWMAGDANGEYFAEYIKDGEDARSWKSGLLLIRRLKYPSADLLEQIEKAKSRVADIMLLQYDNQTQQMCKDKYVPAAKRVGELSGLYFAVGGWYCRLNSKETPFGEGSYVAFVEGKGFVHLVQYSWRPQTGQDANSSEWGIDLKTGKTYLDSIVSSVLCDENKKTCKNGYAK